MINDTRKQLLHSLDSICALAPEMRFGQLMAMLGFLAEDMSDHAIWEIDDEELLRILKKHRAELENRQSSGVESVPRDDR